MQRAEPAASASDPLASTWITEALEQWDKADEATRERLFELFHPQLRQLAKRHMRRERRHDHTLQPTAVVNEFYLGLARLRGMSFNGGAHFLAFASRKMRQLLIDHARTRGAERHGGAIVKVQLDSLDRPESDGQFRGLSLDELLDLDKLLDRYSLKDPRGAKVVELKYFGGMGFKEIEEVLSIDERTAKRHWDSARSWLYGEFMKNRKDKACTGGK